EQLQQSSHQLRGISPESTYISAGMSGDFEVALRFEATHIRIGSSILGTRSPQP
ncbi:MAG: YggS family pyridoxal phosphate-dependent enzyme, partial [Actinobacteria bacterium]|nr:YggS family pyridoxal phosphate-dependent enzyme [Actinomycetota bacterium]